MVGSEIARRIRSGTGVGPGICRKWRPARRGTFDIRRFLPPANGALWVVALSDACMRSTDPSSSHMGPYWENLMNVHVPANRALAERLRREIQGEVLFDRDRKSVV